MTQVLLEGFFRHKLPLAFGTIFHCSSCRWPNDLVWLHSSRPRRQREYMNDEDGGLPKSEPRAGFIRVRRDTRPSMFPPLYTEYGET